MTPVAHSRGVRSLWLAVLAVTVLIIAVARILEPEPSGYGTHTQLGLPPCGFLSLTGLRCPGCGLTTAFAHMVRFDVVEALLANPFGVVLFSCLLLMIPTSMLALRHRWSFASVMQHVVVQRMAAVLVCTAVASWVARTAVDW